MEHRPRLHLLARPTAHDPRNAAVSAAGRAASRRPGVGGGIVPQCDAPPPTRGGGAGRRRASRRGRRRSTGLLAVAILTLFALSAHARTFLTQPQALANAFPGAKVTRDVVYLTPAQLAAAKKDSGLEFSDRMIVRYASPTGYAYFDTHRVRTLAETVMIVVTPDGRIDRVEILSFDEPPDYLPKPRWIAQFRGRKLDDDLSLERAIRPLSGASLSGRAITNASRKILALHRAIGASANGGSTK